MENLLKKHGGYTLIELILSVTLIGLIAVAFIPLFVNSANTNNETETTLDSTYLGKDAMEMAYNLSRTVSYEDLTTELINRGYSWDKSKNTFGYEYNDKKYLWIKFSEEGNLVRVIIKIYKDKSMKQIEVQYETLYSWVGRGILID